MSKSYGNTIDLSDTPEEVTAKCREMFTDPQRIRRKDAGHPETCNLFQFHRLFSTPELQEKVAGECRRAQIGCVDDKQLIADQINSFLEPIRARRADLLKKRRRPAGHSQRRVPRRRRSGPGRPWIRSDPPFRFNYR